MKEYGFNTTLLHGTEETNPFGATQVPGLPVQCIPSRYSRGTRKRFLQINGPDIHIQESTIQQLKLLRNE